MKSYSAPHDNKPNWWVIDAEGVVLGRLAAHVAKILRGKHKPTFTPHIDTGDHVVIINAEKVKLTGKKDDNKIYYRHTGHPGGIKMQTPRFLKESPYAARVIENAVLRMLPKESPLAKGQFSKLKVYKGTQHPHEAQQPQVLDFAKLNPKNKR